MSHCLSSLPFFCPTICSFFLFLFSAVLDQTVHSTTAAVASRFCGRRGCCSPVATTAAVGVLGVGGGVGGVGGRGGRGGVDAVLFVVAVVAETYLLYIPIGNIMHAWSV